MSENKFYELMEVRGLGFLPTWSLVYRDEDENAIADFRSEI